MKSNSSITSTVNGDYAHCSKEDLRREGSRTEADEEKAMARQVEDGKGKVQNRRTAEAWGNRAREINPTRTKYAITARRKASLSKTAEIA